MAPKLGTGGKATPKETPLQLEVGNSDRACDQVGRFRDRPTSVAKPLKP